MGKIFKISNSLGYFKIKYGTFVIGMFVQFKNQRIGIVLNISNKIVTILLFICSLLSIGDSVFIQVNEN